MMDSLAYPADDTASSPQDTDGTPDQVEDPIQDYFANAGSDSIGNELMQLKDEFYKRMRQSGRLEQMRKSWRSSYGLSPNSSPGRSDRVVHGGEQGELTFVRVNHYRNLEQHLLSLTTAQRPSPEPISTNTDNKTYEQTILAKGLLDYYMREKRIERVLRIAAEHAVKLGDGYVLNEWDPVAGDNFMPDPNGGMVKQGDVTLSNPTPLDVIKDLDRVDPDDNDWMMVRVSINRYELAARFRPFADDILSSPSVADSLDKTFRFVPGFEASSDQVYFYKFFHRKSSAVPDGRLTMVTDTGVVLSDGPLPYPKIPINRISPSDVVGLPFGYTPMFDLLAIQEVIDALYSAVATNQIAFGVQNIWVPESSNLSYEQLATGLNLIKTAGTQKPEPLNLASTPPEVFKLIDQLEHAMETISGINAVQRGNVPSNIESGNALALMSAQAIQFSSGLQASYAALIEDVFTDILNMLKEYATTPRVALIVGSYNQHMLKEFTSDDLSSISRVVVDAGSPLTRTAQGRQQMAQDLLQIPNNNLTPQQYLSVYKTGNLDEMTQSQTRELTLIKKENELLSNGKSCRVMPTDNHVLHIKENATVLSNPELRESTPENEAILQATLQHLMEHIQQGSDPMLLPLLTSLGYQPIAPPIPQETMGGGTPAGGGPNMLPPGPDQGGGQDAGPVPSPEADTRNPSFPKNPMTGEEWNPQNGGDSVGPTAQV